MNDGTLRCGGVVRTAGRNGGLGDRPVLVRLSLPLITQETALLEICLHDEGPAISRLCHCMSSIYNLMAAVAAAAAAVFTFSLYNPQSTLRAVHFVTTINLQGVHKNSLKLYKLIKL